jgi:hypothetical protein
MSGLRPCHTILLARAVPRIILHVTDGITSKVSRMLNDLVIEAIETNAERITAAT